MRTAYTVGRASRIDGTVDEDGYSHPEGFGPVEAVQIYGMQPGPSSIPIGAEVTERVITSKLLLVPDTALFAPGDRVWTDGTVEDDPLTGGTFTPAQPGRWYSVSEDVRDYSTGPFGYRPGGAVAIEKVDG